MYQFWRVPRCAKRDSAAVANFAINRQNYILAQLSENFNVFSGNSKFHRVQIAMFMPQRFDVA